MSYTEKDRHHFSKPPEEVAPWLLGKLLCRKVGEKTRKFRMTEVEAYPGTDSACYAYGTKPEEASEATRPLFGPGGTCCIYGGMLLIACGEENLPGNVLIRAAGDEETYCDGPVKLCDTLGIDKALHGADLLAPNAALWLEDDSEGPRCCKVPRVGLGFLDDEQDRTAKRRFIAL